MPIAPGVYTVGGLVKQAEHTLFYCPQWAGPREEAERVFGRTLRSEDISTSRWDLRRHSDEAGGHGEASALELKSKIGGHYE